MELSKIRIREHTITYSKQTALKTNKKQKTKKQKHKLRKKYQNAKNPENLLQQKIPIKTELEINALAAARGAQTRARVKFIEKGEQNRTHFLSLKKIKIPATTIASLKTDNDIAITNQADLLHEQERFYSNPVSYTHLRAHET